MHARSLALSLGNAPRATLSRHDRTSRFCRPLESITSKMLFPQILWNHNHTKNHRGVPPKGELQAKLRAYPATRCYDFPDRGFR